uniref:Uncharacterized protein n=1 Tax=Romanomermis culicivorax TaxID=13658 RepID=A0A915KHM2_ROMCU
MFSKTLSVFGVGHNNRRMPVDDANANLLCTFYFKDSEKTLFYLPNGDEMSFAKFETLIGQYAGCLKQLGVKKGDRVAAQVSKTAGNIALYLATLQLGAIYIPLNTDYKLDEIHYFLTDSEPVLFVCQEENKLHYLTLDLDHELHFLTIVGEEELRHAARKSLAHLEIEHMHPDDVASICYTSDENLTIKNQEAVKRDWFTIGWFDNIRIVHAIVENSTTGRPKGAMITHSNLSTNAESLCRIWRFMRQDILLHALPVYHVHGLFVALNTVFQKGCSVIFLPKFDTDLVMQYLPKCTMMMGVPTYYTRLLHNANFEKNLVKSVRIFISGSAPLLDNTWLEFKRRTGHEILERYGMTEGQMICSNPYDGPRKPVLLFLFLGTVGLPLPNVQVRIRKGVLEYKGPNLFKGYWRLPEKTKNEFSDDGYFISGDLAKRDENGFISILGRCKDLIISGGLNVYPKEIEQEIDSLAGVLESSVIGVPHLDFGEAVVALVVVNEQEQKISEMEIIKILKTQIANYKVPKKILFVDSLPRNKMGKVQKNLLRDSFKNLFSN